MKKKFLIFIFAILCLIPFNTFAEEIDKTKTGGDLSYDELIEFFSKYLNYDNFILLESKTGSPRYAFILFYDDMIPKVKNDSIGVSSSSREISYYTSRLQTYYLPKNSLIYKIQYPETRTAQVTLSSYDILYSTIDIINDSDDSVYFAKNFSYKKKVVCPDVNVDIPITKEEFYVLLMLVSLLILLLFFKWCFPNKGGKDV